MSSMGEANTFINAITSLENVSRTIKWTFNTIPGSEQKADILTKALGRIKFKEMRDLVGVQELKNVNFKFKGDNVRDNLEVNLGTKLN